MNRSKLSAIASGRCPRCREGKLFKYSWLKMGKFDQMHKYCPHCGLRYEREPGFFIGAMYVSYGITTGIILVTAFVLFYGFNDPSPFVYIGVSIGLIILCVPFTFRLSRILYIHLFSGVNYEEHPEKIHHVDV
ncbi:MAG: DUF983 domain-containing protein [Siphonobacter sp.]